MRKTYDNPEAAPKPGGHYTNVIKVESGDSVTLHLSGQIALDHDGEVVAPGDMTKQSHVVMEIIGKLLAAHGAGFDDIVNIRTFLTDMDRLREYGDVRRTYFDGEPPTSTTVEVTRLFRPGALLEVEVVAVIAA
ncbi:RidA family protein [Stackebrandtia nassauensis]|uniref:Endoribonuclease L-PSP n=1 Tax=Stackebrandtia nassauensis (strain DSM 44728 / CIP 108903 / NRRL B-16338 / NBRC 102104 / LLR-40K-21) TaxID=446470 RepID=D3PZQ4_STANL|nr:RidA family protein [Stackebrandtia nassauensis]ADD43591.1 Endoribonuclease L-PSP [Stackebrandtia nassauensis DSM 44728]